MKTIDSISRTFDKKRFKAKKNNTLEYGITMRLLEKYKPKGLTNGENTREKKTQARGA